MPFRREHLIPIRRVIVCIISLISIFATLAPAQQFDPKLYQELRWRLIGPFRGGRSVAISGIQSQPNVFLMAANNGGVWRTTDYGRTWNPIFDDQPTGSIGGLAIAASNPDVIYVGSGEGLRRPDLSTGDGIYKSLDGAVPGNISDCAMDSRLAPSWLTLTIPTGFSPACSAIRMGPMRSGAFFVPSMAASDGRKFCIRTKTPELSISSLIRITRKLFMRTCGLRAAHRGRRGILTTVLEAACTNLPMAAVRGDN